MKAFITGATRGIGRAILEELLPDLDHVVLLSRSTRDLDVLRSECESRRPGLRAQAVAADLSELAGTRSSIREWSTTFEGAIDVLVVNAGTYTEGDLADIDIDIFESDLRVNLSSAVLVVQELLPHLRLAKTPRIVIVGSTAAYEDYPAVPSYGVAKWGLRSFASNLRHELREEKIGVTFLSPGGTLTSMWDGEDVPPGRLLDPSDIGVLVAASLRLSSQAVVEELIVRPIEGDMHD